MNRNTDPSRFKTGVISKTVRLKSKVFFHRRKATSPSHRCHHGFADHLHPDSIPAEAFAGLRHVGFVAPHANLLHAFELTVEIGVRGAEYIMQVPASLTALVVGVRRRHGSRPWQFVTLSRCAGHRWGTRCYNSSHRSTVAKKP